MAECGYSGENNDGFTHIWVIVSQGAPVYPSSSTYLLEAWRLSSTPESLCIPLIFFFFVERKSCLFFQDLHGFL